MDRSESISAFSTLERAEENESRINLVRAVTWLVIVGCVVLIATSAWLIVRARAQEVAQSQLSNTNLARAVTEQIEGSISEIAHIVDGLVFELERANTDRLPLQNLQPVLVNHVAGVEALKGLFIYDAKGGWMVHSEAVSNASLNNSDREYFQFHKGNLSERVRIGAPLVSRSSGEWVIPISRRINDTDGNFNGVALATLSVGFLRSVLEKYNVGQGGAITLAMRDRLLVRRPFKVDEIGMTIPASALQKAFESSKSGVIDGPSSIDKVDRIISFDHMRNYPIRVAVALAKDEVLEEWRTASFVQAGLTLVLCLLLASSGAYVIRAMRLRLDAEAGLRETRDALSIANERLSHLAQYDGLTGLPNRRYFDSRFARVFEKAQREQRLLSVVLVDVDQFKNYNDRYGHVQGDECLRQIAQAVLSSIERTGDFVARYGGEELVMLLPDTDAAGAALIAEDARAAVVSRHIPHEATTLGIVSISLGVATAVPGASAERYALVTAADEALYIAKSRGRNQVYSKEAG